VKADVFTLVSCLVLSALKMEAIYSSEMTVDFQQTTCYYIAKYSTLQSTEAHIPIQEYQIELPRVKCMCVYSIASDPYVS
jgi:hypothetical protein